MAMTTEVKKDEIQETVTTNQPSITTVPKLFQKWNELVLKEIDNAEETAELIFKKHMETIEAIGILNGFKLGYKLSLLVTSERTELYRAVSEGEKITNQLLNEVPQPLAEIKNYPPEARKAYYKRYLALIQEEFGNVKAYKMFELHPEIYLQEVIPWLKKTTTSQKTPQVTGEPSVQRDDIELLFQNRRK